MAKISWKPEKDFAESKKYLRKLHTKKFRDLLFKYADLGLTALKEATPKDTGFTAQSWYSNVLIGETYARVYWHNEHLERSKKGQYNIAIILDAGHGTGTGGYVKPLNYIDPALQPILEQLSEAIRKEVL